jgi:methyl-accepting chemotaxis protein
LKRELDELHLLSEHIDHKIKSLHQQRGLVEKANDDAGRLNVLVWDMDSKIKKLKDESKLIKSADRGISRLEGMLDMVSDKVDEIVSFKEMMRTGSVTVEEMKTALQEMDSRLTLIHQEKESIMSYARDTEDLKRTLEVVKEDYETLLGKSHLVSETHDSLNRLSQEISDLKVESKNISVKNEMIRSISGRLRDLDMSKRKSPGFSMKRWWSKKRKRKLTS